MSNDLVCRAAGADDAPLLAHMNWRLIRDEGHENPMSVAELTTRMRGWLEGDYRAAVFAVAERTIGYALYRREPEFVYLRQFFIEANDRRHGYGRAAVEWLAANCWTALDRVRLDVLTGNTGGRAFWKAVGFSEYCVTMERRASDA